MAFKLTPPVFRREVQRRLIDTHDVMKLTGLASRSSVSKRVRAGTLPPPIVGGSRRFALWDLDEIENHPDMRKGSE